MNKEELLEGIKSLSAQNAVTKQELELAYKQGRNLKVKKTDLVDILYYIGGGIIFLGIVILIWQNWSSLNTVTRIIATLGSSIAAYIVGVIFNRYKNLNIVGQAFFFVSALVLPVGLFVLFDSFGFELEGAGMQSIVSAIALLVYLVSFAIFRKNIFIIFSFIFATWLFFAFTDFLIASKPHFDDLKLIEYRLLFSGISYILLGYWFFFTKRRILTAPLYGFGVLGFLLGGILLGGWKPEQSIFWELIYPVIIFAVIFLSVKLKSKSFLIFGSIFLMAYIIKMTSEYFQNSLGWPFALVLAGLALMLIAYFSLYINTKYLRK